MPKQKKIKGVKKIPLSKKEADEWQKRACKKTAETTELVWNSIRPKGCPYTPIINIAV